MIQRIEIKGVHFTIDDKLRRYIERKLGGLDSKMSRHSKESAHLEVVLKELKQKGARALECHATLHLPQEVITIKEATVNIYAAVDITEAKLKLALKKYKDTHEQSKLTRHLFARRRVDFAAE